MGLDMYLRRKLYIGGNFEHNNIAGKVEITKDNKLLPIDVNEITFIELVGAYWRKANHIHRWFVDNVQDGTDDCGEYDVTKEDLRILVSVCKDVLANRDKTSELLPTQEGFFFGSTSYDEGYFADCEYTIKTIGELLEKIDLFDNTFNTSTDITYQSSW